MCVLLATTMASQACYRTAQLDVVRPAMINAAPYGNTYEVRNVDGDPQAAEHIRSELRARIVASLNRGLSLAETNGALALVGNIRRLEYSENDTRTDATCSHTETVDGREERRENPCVNVARNGEVQAQIEFRVFVVATQQVLFTRTYDATRSTRVNGREGPYRTDNIALRPIDQGPLRNGAIDEIVGRFARVILPWMDTVELNFEGCDGDARCGQAYEAVQQRNLEGAERLVTAVVGQDGATVPDAQRARVGEALYNRAMIRMIRGLYGGAFIDLQRAIELLPQRQGFRTRYQQLEQLARDQDALREQQGVTDTTVQPAEQGQVLGPAQG